MSHICILYRGSRRRKGEKGAENLFVEIMAENFPHLVKRRDIQVEEARRVPNKIYPKRPVLRHIIIKMSPISNNMDGPRGLSC